MGDLGKRVAVAAVGIPVVLALIYVGGWMLAVPLAALAALGARELCALSVGAGTRPFEPLASAAAAALVLLASWRPEPADFAAYALVMLGAVAATAVVGAVAARRVEEQPLTAIAVTTFVPIYAGLTLATVPLLHAMAARGGWATGTDAAWGGLAVLALPLAATWVGDASAYFVGSAWGRSKLAPSISPNKSWAGLWAGLIGAAAASGAWWLVVAPRLPGLPLGLVGAVVLGALLGGAAAVGDLAESLLKREAGVKDSGTLFPGHGGALDRLDALTFTLPLTLAALMLLEALR